MTKVNGEAEETLNHSKLAKEHNHELCMMAEQLSKLVLQILEGRETTISNVESSCDQVLVPGVDNADATVTLFD